MKSGASAHGAPVCLAWNSTVGIHGRYNNTNNPKPSTPSLKNARRASRSVWRHSTRNAAPDPKARNNPQLCAYTVNAMNTLNTGIQRRSPTA